MATIIPHPNPSSVLSKSLIEYQNGHVNKSTNEFLTLELNDMVNTFGKLIPGLEKYGKEMVVGDFIYELCKIGHGSLARQLLQEVGEKVCLIDDACLLLDRNIRGVGLTRNDIVNRSMWLTVQSVAENFDKYFAIPTSSLNSDVLKVLNDSFALTALVRRIYTDENKMRALAICIKFNRFKLEKNVMDEVLLHIHNIRMLRLWYKACHAGDNNNGKDERIWTALLEKAIKLDATYEMARIVEYGNGHFAPKKIAQVFDRLARARKKTPNTGTAADSAACMEDESEFNSTLFQKVIGNTPTKTVHAALYKTLKSWDFAILPGRFLWAFIYGIQSTALVIQPKLEFALVQTIIHRPAIEQLRLINSPIASIYLLSQFCTLKLYQLENSRHSKQPLTNVDYHLKLLSASLLLMNSNLKKSTTSLLPGRKTRKLLEQMDLVVIEPGEEEKKKKQGELSRNLILRTISVLLYFKQNEMVIRILESLDEIPATAYFQFLEANASTHPTACRLLLTHLKNQHITIPESTLKKLGWEFIKIEDAAQLSDANFTRYFLTIALFLKQQGRYIGGDLASAFVDTIIKRAETRDQGSRQRLEMALRIAKRQPDVIDTGKWKEWDEKLKTMQYNRKGYWHRL